MINDLVLNVYRQLEVTTKVLGLKGLNGSFGEEEKRDSGGWQGVGGWRERERLRGLAGSCSSVVARERHVTCCLATLSN